MDIKIVVILLIFLLILIVALYKPKNTRVMSGGFQVPSIKIPKDNLPVREPWLRAIQMGRKTVEGRTGPRQRYAGWIGKRVTFWNHERVIPVTVRDVHWYPDLYKYLEGEDWKKVAPHLNSLEETIKAYHEFYNDARIAKAGGMCGIVVAP